MKSALENIKIRQLLKVVLLLVTFSGFFGCDDKEEPNPIPEDIRAVNRFILDNMDDAFQLLGAVKKDERTEYNSI